MNLLMSKSSMKLDLALRVLKSFDPAPALAGVRRKRALTVARKASREVPAYRDFLKTHGWTPEDVQKISWSQWAQLPIADKDSYIRKYPLEARCLNGRLPLRGKIDESGGTSGQPTEWVHSLEEEGPLLETIGLYRKIWWPDAEEIILVNAFSCGPWSGGVTMTLLLRHDMLVKTVGTDIEGVLQTLRSFGPKYQYIISGYPLFLSEILKKDFPWNEYRVDLITGGDAHSLGWQKQVEKRVNGRVVSAYGASDVSMGLGVETPLTHAIRSALAEEEELRQQLSWYGEVPMVFQFNPLNVLVEQNDRELVMTYLTPLKAHPVVRYNLHDEGRVLSYRELRGLITSHSPSLATLFERSHLRLPFLIVEGRSDGAISLDGANVQPNQIEDILSGVPEVHRFKMARRENPPHFVVLVEAEGAAATDESLRARLSRILKEELVRRNRDFAESLAANPALAPQVVLLHSQHPIFLMDQRKYRWVVTEEVMDRYSIPLPPSEP